MRPVEKKPAQWCKMRELTCARDLRTYTDNISDMLEIKDLPALNKDVSDYIFSTIKKLILVYDNLHDEYKQEQFRTAMKNADKDMSKLCQIVLSKVDFESNGNLSVHKTWNRIRVTIDSKILVEYTIKSSTARNRYANIFKKLFDREFDTIEEIAGTVKVMLAVVNWHNDIRLSDSESDKQIKSEIEDISGKSKYITNAEFMQQYRDKSNNYINDIVKTLELLVEYTKSDKLTHFIPKWARPMVTALRKAKRLEFEDVPPHLSSKSTCSRLVNGKRKERLPGVLASIYEPDFVKEAMEVFDNRFGFKQSYRSKYHSYLAEVESLERKASVIEQHKWKDRLIQLCSNCIQDRLMLFEKLDDNILKSLKDNDCLYDQYNGVKHIIETFDNRPSWSIYSLDLSQATNTMLLAAQNLVHKYLYSIWYNDEEVSILLDTFEYLMTQKTTVKLRGGEEITFSLSSGQPMGYLGSFKSFSLLHHIIAITICRLHYPNEDIRLLYRILGDDFVLTCYDPDMKMPQVYIDYIENVNVECQMSKGYLYNPDIEEYSNALAEFARHLIISGHDVTCPPIKLLCARTDYEYLGLYIWLSDHMGKLDGRRVIDLLFNKHKVISHDAKLLLEYELSLPLPEKISRIKDAFLFKEQSINYTPTKFDLVVEIQSAKDSILLTLGNLYFKDALKDRDFKLFRFRGYNKVKQDLEELFSKQLLNNNKLGLLYNELLEFNSNTSSIFEALFFGTEYANIDTTGITILPVFDWLMSIYTQSEFQTLIKLLVHEVDLDDPELDIQMYLTLLRRIRKMTQYSVDRSWSTYGNLATCESYDLRVRRLSYGQRTGIGEVIHPNKVMQYLENVSADDSLYHHPDFGYKLQNSVLESAENKEQIVPDLDKETEELLNNLW